MKKTRLIVILFTTFILVYLLYLVLTSNKNNNNSLLPTPLPSISIIQNSPTGSTQPTLSQKQSDQLQADYEFGQWQKNNNNNYPWLKNLPLQSNKFYVYFDLDQKKFIADIYVPNEQNNIKQEVLTQLKNLGIDMGKFEITWNVK